MERSRLLQCLAADYMRLRDVAGTSLTAQVPTCPAWTVTDLVRHVAQVYLHKATVMNTGAWPDPWPPAEIATEPPIALLDRGYGALTHEFSRRGDTDRALTWHEPDQTVKFWIRRMAQESVIHRLDAELAADTDIAPIPDDLALDGIDEVLRLFVDYGSKAWSEDFAGVLPAGRSGTVLVRAAGSEGGGGAGSAGFAAGGALRAWEVRMGPAGVTATPVGAAAHTAVDAEVTGPPAPLLRWLWARETTPTTDAPDAVEVKGDEDAIKELRALLTAGTQ